MGYLPPTVSKEKLMSGISFLQEKVQGALILGTSLQVAKATVEKGLTDLVPKEVIKKKMKMMVLTQKKSIQHPRPRQ